MKFEEIKEEKLSKDDVLWRFLSFHKLLFLLCEKKLFFPRLDLLPDPFEGVSMKLIQERRMASISPERKNWHPDIPVEVHEEREKQNEATKKRYQEESKAQRMSQYVNCWFNGNRESMAMWDIYSNRESVAVRISGRNFIDYLERLIALEPYKNPKLKLIAGSVKYYELNPVNLTIKSVVRYIGLKKDVAFDFEKEYRLLILTNNKDFLKNPPSITVDLTKDFLQMIEIVTHPQMDNWRFSNIQNLCNALGVNKIERYKIEFYK